MNNLITKNFIVEKESDLQKIAEEIIQACRNNRVVALFGAMGAGKTTLVRYLCQELHVIDTVQSPTFSIINEYHCAGEEKIFHFDFYRIRKLEEVFDIGYEDYFYSDSWCFIEWPEMIMPLLPENAVRISIEGNQNREITLISPGN